MATNGTFTRYFKLRSSPQYDIPIVSNADDATFSLTVTWSAVQDVVYCKSTINWTLTATAIDFTKSDGNFNGASYSGIQGAADGSCAYIIFGTDDTTMGSSYNDLYVAFNGTRYTTKTLSKTLKKGDVNLFIASGSFTVNHNDKGEFGPYTFDFKLAMKNWYDANGNPGLHYNTSVDLGGYYGVIARAAAETTLDTISKHAIIYYDTEEQKVKDFNDEDASVAINYAMPSGMSAQLYLSLDGNATTESTHLVTVTGAGTHNYSFTDADRRKMWLLLDQGLDNKRVKFFIKSTADDGTIFREPSNWVNLEIVNYMPTIDNPTVIDVNPVTKLLTGDYEKLIRYASTAKFTTNAHAKKHYSIATESCTPDGGNPVYGATGEIPNVASNFFTFSATDNAGRRVQTVHEVPEEYGYWIPYVKLTCNATTTEMTADGDVEITVRGQYFNGSFGDQSNTLKITCTYAENNGEPQVRTYTNVRPTMNGNDYTYTFTLNGLQYLSVYEVQITAEDKVMPQPAVANIVVASTPIFDWGRKDFNFNVPVTITDGEVSASVPSIIEQGTTYSGWNFRKWSDGLYECWQRKAIPAKLTSASSASGWWTSGVMSATNLSYPIEFTELPTVNVSLSPTTNTWAFVVPGSTAGSTEQTGAFQLLATYQHDTNRDYIFNYQVKGKWK